MGVKKWLSTQFRLQMLSLNHDTVSDFYLSPWQKNESLLPVLIFRVILFQVAVITFFASILLTKADVLQYWAIYLTNWSVCLQLLTTGFAVAISAKYHFTKTTDISLGIPWYVKIYWCLVNILTPVAILITAYYYALLYVPGEADNLLVDVMTHGINSVVVVLLLLTSRTPNNMLHSYQPVIFYLLYTIFNVTYYLAGGTNPDGEVWIYPAINWSEPGSTILSTLTTLMVLLLIHLNMVFVAAGRDILSNKIRGTKKEASLEDAVATL